MLRLKDILIYHEEQRLRERVPTGDPPLHRDYSAEVKGPISIKPPSSGSLQGSVTAASLYEQGEYPVGILDWEACSEWMRRNSFYD